MGFPVFSNENRLSSLYKIVFWVFKENNKWETRGLEALLYMSLSAVLFSVSYMLQLKHFLRPYIARPAFINLVKESILLCNIKNAYVCTFGQFLV